VYSLTKAMYTGAADAAAAGERLQAMRDQIATLTPRATGATAESLAAFDKKLSGLGAAEGASAPAAGGRGGGRGGRGGGAPAGGPANALTVASQSLAGVMNLLQAADVPATTVELNAITAALTRSRATMAAWTTVTTVDLPALNAKLKAAGLPAIDVH